MLNLNTNLNSVGISAAKGIELITQRDELSATLPRGNSAKGEAAASDKKTPPAGKTELSAEQQRQVRELQQIDQKVRAHEQAHISIGRELVTSGPNYSYTYGPDGKQYATAGEVGIDTSAESKPEENIDKGQRIQATALAPADPSPQDYRAASVGSQLESAGRGDLIRQQQDERIAQEQAAQQRRAEQSGEAAAPEEAGAIPAEGAQNARDLRQVLQNAYASGAGGAAQSGQVSEFA